MDKCTASRIQNPPKHALVAQNLDFMHCIQKFTFCWHRGTTSHISQVAICNISAHTLFRLIKKIQKSFTHTNRQRDVDRGELLSLLLQRVDPQLAFLPATRSCRSVPLQEALPPLIRVVISRPPPATSGGLSGWHLNTAGKSKQRCLLRNATAKWQTALWQTWGNLFRHLLYI